MTDERPGTPNEIKLPITEGEVGQVLQTDENGKAKWVDMVTREQYRELMNRYSRQTAVMSFTVVKHPDYQTMLALGEKIVPYLLEDVQSQNPDGSWSTNEDYWGSFWGAIHLLWTIVKDAPVLPAKDRGRLMPIRKLWVKWGIRKGYLEDMEPKTKPWYAWRPWQK